MLQQRPIRQMSDGNQRQRRCVAVFGPSRKSICNRQWHEGTSMCLCCMISFQDMEWVLQESAICYCPPTKPRI